MDARRRDSRIQRSRDVSEQSTDRTTRPGSSKGRPAGKKNRRSRAKVRRKRRRKRIIRFFVFLLILLVVGMIGGKIFWERYGPSKEKADLNEYYGITSEDDIAVIIDNEVIKDSETGSTGGKIIDGETYIEYSVVRKYINKRFYWDSNENVLLYTLPNGNVSVDVGSSEYKEVSENKSENYVILKAEGRTAYIALPFIQKYTNMDYSVYDTPNRAVITRDWREIQSAVLKKDTEVRYLGGVKSVILTEVNKSDRVVVLEDEDNWMKVATEDGFIGYVPTRTLGKIKTETISREFSEFEYSNISMDEKINLAWHNVENEQANEYVLETIDSTKGLNVIAPTWFSIADTDGNLRSIASPKYVDSAHKSNLEVWAVLRDFHGGISSFDETYEVLSYTSKRTSLINQVIGAALQNGIDGINLDFELISTECGEHYIQFVRELSVKCRQNGIVFSIDNYVPHPYNEHYDLEEQAVMADYVVIMCYDEHIDGSYTAGSVASYNYVRKGIEDALEAVPAQKLVEAIPLFTRLWHETPKTESELAEEEGTEAARYATKVSSTALSMDEATKVLEENGITAVWDEETKQNYAEWEAKDGTYKIWLEDYDSLNEKLKISKEYNLAGIASWKLGLENSSVWDLILQYVN
ncbi:MAG: glycosyl hydrolase family 18 protein [Schaedlerella sp.]|nr:glycosyl hydrolase family 18 protein [Schaedlerella sp.]